MGVHARAVGPACATACLWGVRGQKRQKRRSLLTLCATARRLQSRHGIVGCTLPRLQVNGPLDAVSSPKLVGPHGGRSDRAPGPCRACEHLLEERVTSNRQSAYEDWVGAPASWPDWREAHRRYVQDEVRRHPLSAAFDGDIALRPELEPNQYLYRVERIDSVLNAYVAEGGVVTPQQVGEWIAQHNSGGAPAASALEDLTQFLNEEFSDGRPRFVAFAAEFPDLAAQLDWPRIFCERCGLAHHFGGTAVTLALFRYSVREVLDAYRDIVPTATVFAVPTVLDLPMSSVYFSAPASLHVGHAVGLVPRDDCSHLAAELIHARLDYRPEHWVAVGTLRGNALSDAEITRLRDSHLGCLRSTPGNAEYGVDCVG